MYYVKQTHLAVALKIFIESNYVFDPLFL